MNDNYTEVEIGLSLGVNAIDYSRVDKASLRYLCRSIEHLRQLSSGLTIQAAQLFLEIYLHPGSTIKDLAKRTKQSQASCSRNIALLSKTHRSRKPGLNLIIATEDPAYRRQKVVYLTHDGLELARILSEISE